jgi:putative DNA modification/repair radical SAM protein
MQILAKLKVLADAAKYDASCASSGARRAATPGGLGSTDGSGICHSYTPDGRCVSLLKILLTNFCIYECRYCVNRASSDVQRARFTPDEVVQLTLDFYRRNYIEGLFLSSGIIQSPDYTMEQLVAVARTLRTTHRFGGYIHLKTIPGAAVELVEEAGRYADRLSVNVELPTGDDLRRLAPDKTLEDIESTMGQVHDRVIGAREERRKSMLAPRYAPAGQSTQMIVGATPAPDRTILATASSLYREHGLRRVYYSAFSPIPHHDSALVAAAPPLVREHRLYEADWLMRFYGFKAEELTTPEQPSLDLAVDPKRAWAARHPEFFPVDVNAAPREALLRVPGIGYRNVARILKVRRYHRIAVADLRKLRVVLSRARPFIIAADWLPARAAPEASSRNEMELLRTALVPRPVQASLFAPLPALTGEL